MPHYVGNFSLLTYDKKVALDNYVFGGWQKCKILLTEDGSRCHQGPRCRLPGGEFHKGRPLTAVGAAMKLHTSHIQCTLQYNQATITTTKSHTTALNCLIRHSISKNCSLICAITLRWRHTEVDQPHADKTECNGDPESKSDIPLCKREETPC